MVSRIWSLIMLTSEFALPFGRIVGGGCHVVDDVRLADEEAASVLVSGQFSIADERIDGIFAHVHPPRRAVRCEHIGAFTEKPLQSSDFFFCGHGCVSFLYDQYSYIHNISQKAHEVQRESETNKNSGNR